MNAEQYRHRKTTSPQHDELEAYHHQLDAALIKYIDGDPRPFERLMETVGVPKPSHPVAQMAGVTKAIVKRCASLPDRVVDVARDWLDSRGMSYG